MLSPEDNLSSTLTSDELGDPSDHTLFHSEGISLQKWAAMGLLSGVSLFCGLLPFWTLSRNGRNGGRGQVRQILTIFLSNASGGILLSTLFLHIFPELRHKAGHLISSSHKGEHQEDQIFRNLPELLTLFGFCLIFFLEVAATTLMPSSHAHHHHHHHYDHPPRECDPEEVSPCEKNRLGSDETLEHSDSPLQYAEHSEVQVNSSKSVWKVVVSLMALSFHAVMEGVAVGLQGGSQLWMTFAAIASHKFLISFCVGVELVRAKASIGTTLTSLASFALVSPIGILLGSSAISIAETYLLVAVEGVACGTLLYVVFFDILSNSNTTIDHNYHHSESSCSSSFCKTLLDFVPFTGVATGILISIYLMSISGGHSHDHNHLH